MRRKLWIVMAWCLMSPLLADPLTVVGEREGLMPYYYGTELDQGVLVDVLHEFTRSTGIEARFYSSTTRRFQWDLEHGHANAMFGHPAWFPVPERLHLIGPLFHWRDRLFAQPELEPEALESLEGSICLRKHYTYSESLESLLGGPLMRFDAKDADQLVRMFLRKRCDYVIMDDLEFRHLAGQGEVNPDLYETSIIEAEWPVYLGILKSQSALIEAAEGFFTPDRFAFENYGRDQALPPISD